ncbi:hypothetical protein IFM89_034904 [Coptis chinensis]|uniref:SUZ domain-containing protein n=1 Tax=Coptis chinensis TaxID=261450 RepID=A0A835I6P0_9MAGN|nr:hypothetical protein IFM89_034904 [Coptis chinensis]
MFVIFLYGTVVDMPIGHITQGDIVGKAVIVSWVTQDEPGSNTVLCWKANDKQKSSASAEGKERGTVVEEEEDEDSWEMADLDKTMSRLLVSSKTTSVVSTPPSGGVSNNQVDEFLREALQNPRERLSILRIEQDVVKFISNPSQQQLEFQQLPTSYLRLAAHRVAQHYQLESLDIPLSLPHGDNNGSVKVAIKQRPGKCSESANNASRSSKWNHAKSVEERKEEYNRARARIFSSENGTKGDNVKVLQPCSLRSKGVDERFIVQGPESPSKGYDSSTGRCRTEHDPAGRYKTNNKVAIFRDRDVDRKDPDYDRSYNRYTLLLIDNYS